MDQCSIVAVNCRHLLSDSSCHRLVDKKHLFPIGNKVGFVNAETKILIKYRKKDGQIVLDDDSRLQEMKETFCLKPGTNSLSDLETNFRDHDYCFLFFQGSPAQARLVCIFDVASEGLLSKLEDEEPTLRLSSFDLPPASFTYLEGEPLRSNIVTFFSKSDPELFSLRTHRFLRNPHILTNLFAHVMSLESSEHINYISKLRVISDRLREFLKPRIKRIEKNHHSLWAEYYGSQISFVDGGMSRIISLPGVEPMGIRVGVYSVVPGETDSDKREDWYLDSHVIGDVVSDRAYIHGSPAFVVGNEGHLLASGPPIV